MQITEIKQAISEAPDLKKAIIDMLTADGIVVRTKDEDANYLSSNIGLVAKKEADKLYQERFDGEFATAMNTIDEQIRKITGIEKKPNEKTTVFAERAIGEIKTGNGKEANAQLEELRQSLQAKEREYSEKLASYEKEFFEKERNWMIGSVLDGMTIAVPGHIKDEAQRQAFAEQQKNLIKSGFLSSFVAKKDEAGKVVYYDGDKPLLNSKDGNPLTARELLTERFGSWFMPEGHRAAGAGTGNPGGTAGQGGKGFAKTDDIHGYLKQKGIAVTSPEYMKQFGELAKEAGIEI